VLSELIRVGYFPRSLTMNDTAINYNNVGFISIRRCKLQIAYERYDLAGEDRFDKVHDRRSYFRWLDLSSERRYQI